MTQNIRTLIVDDEEGVRFFLRETLTREGHTVTEASSGEQALDMLRDSPYDLVVLDLNLGGRIDGLRVLEAARWRWPAAAAVILTAHGTLDSALAAIREGIDGYLTKPVEPAELRRAVRDALARRKTLSEAQSTTEPEPSLECGPFTVDLERHLVAFEGKALELTPFEFKLLCHLAQNSERVISPQELVRVVQDYECEHLYEAREIIKWYIHRLRRKVEPEPSNPRYIVSVRGVGYTFRP